MNYQILAGIITSWQGFLSQVCHMEGFTVDYGLAVQLASYTPKLLNEFRFQYAQRRNPGSAGRRNEFSGTGPSIVISDVARFGSPDGTGTSFP
ncbi:MAG: hypothetical protein LC802_10855, partial [Acidobacteria bacterium]|nr:hypothetical protein [Acidobacteriota bacterium]